MWTSRRAAKKFLSGATLTFLCSKLAFAQSPAQSSSAPFSVDLERDTSAVSCPDLGWFRREIASHAGPAPQAGTFKITLTKQPNAWRAVIHRFEPQANREPVAERVLGDRSTACEPLAQAVAITIAILAEDHAQQDQPAPPPPPPPPPPLPASDAPISSKPATAPLRVWVGAGGGAAFSWISPAAPVLGFGIALDSLRLRQALRVMLTTEQTFQMHPGQVVVQGWLATLLSCARLSLGRGQGPDRQRESGASAALCAALDAALLRGNTQGFADGEPSTRGYGAVGLELQPAWTFSGAYRISAALGGLVPFTQQSFSVTGLGPAYIPPPLNWRALLFFELGAF